MGVFSLMLMAIGAILTFGVSANVEGADVGAIGVILMVVGAIGLIFSLFTTGFTSFKSQTTRSVSEDGRTVIEESKTNAL